MRIPTAFGLRASHPESHARGEDTGKLRLLRGVSAHEFRCHHSTLSRFSQPGFADPLQRFQDYSLNDWGS